MRQATPSDIPAMVALSAAKRRAYAEAQPRFWRPAHDADARQAAWFERLLGDKSTIALVADGSAQLDGFLIGLVNSAPPVYDPGGPTCMVDDFCVTGPELWATVGAGLLREASALAKARGCVQMVVVCGVHDAVKRAVIGDAGLAPTSLWFAGGLDRGQDQSRSTSSSPTS